MFEPNMMNLQERKRDGRVTRWVCLLFLWAIVLYLARTMWLPSGTIVFSDLDYGVVDDHYMERIADLFNPHFSSMNFFNLSRLVFILPYYLISLATGHHIPSALLRSMIIGILLITATGIFRLCESLLKRHLGQFQERYHYIGILIPSLYYTLNPWVIFRVQHIFLLAGYACFPWVLHYFFKIFTIYQTEREASGRIELLLERRQGRRDMIKLAFFVGVGSAGIHYFFYYMLTIGFLSVLITLYNLRLGMQWRDAVRYFVRKTFFVYGWCFLFTAYWTLSYIIASSLTNIEPGNVNVVDTLEMFSRYSTLKNVLFLVSYWWPMFDTDKYFDIWFWLGGGMFLAIICFIIFFRYRWHYYVRLFTWMAIVMVIIALGVNQPFISDFNVWLVTKVPLLGQIFRDPNKLLGPLALYFAVLLSFGVDKLIMILRQTGFSRIVQVMFVLVLFISFYAYYRPFEFEFINRYYAGVTVPPEYTTVQDQYLPGGKILWVPTLENMVLSNGLSGYSWNHAKDYPNDLKTSGDFHVYSSSKGTLFQNEGNTGMVSYFDSYVQDQLDTGAAQHLGSLLGWAGFNEMGFHQDVYGQGERQAFNKNVLDRQSDLTAHYKDSIFTLYKTPGPSSDLFSVDRAVYDTKGLNSLEQLLDYRSDLQVDTSKSALFWGQQRKQDVDLAGNALLIGDQKWDFELPQLPDQDFYYPFDMINTGNPDIGWAKTLAREPDWFWLLNKNKLQNDWGFDYGRGIVYTTTSKRFALPSYSVARVEGTKLLGMDEVENGFFTPDNPDIFQVTYFPGPSKEGPAIVGTIQRSSVANPNWQVAKSKLMQVEGGRFLRINAVVSGQNAGTVHFKVHFFNSQNEEFKVSYVTNSNVMSEFTRATMKEDLYVPEAAKFMRIDIMTKQDTVKPVYFWIHDFGIFDLSAYKTDNTIPVTLRNAPNNRYHVLIRAFKNSIGDVFHLKVGTQEIPIKLESTHDRFEWIDLGNLEVPDHKLVIEPGDGLTAINAICAVPEADWGKQMAAAEGRMQGAQADLSLVSRDYDVDLDVRAGDLLPEIRTIPSAIGNTLLPIHQGRLTKTLDLLHDGTYNFSLTGELPKGSTVRVRFQNSNGQVQELHANPDAGKMLDHIFSGMHGEIQQQVNQYYLSMANDLIDAWRDKRYDLGQVKLDKGSYTVEITVDAHVDNLVKPATLHPYRADEMIIPPSQDDEQDQAIRLLDYLNTQQITISKDTSNSNQVVYRNNAGKSQLWIIYGLDRVPVKKGQLLLFQSQTKATGVKDLNAKLLFVDTKNVLYHSVYLDGGTTGQEFNKLVEVPQDGYVYPSYFLRPDPKSVGSFAVGRTVLLPVDRFVKLEGTALLPTDLGLGAGISHKQYVISNETFNTVWRYGNLQPVATDLLHNAFDTSAPVQSGMMRIEPKLTYSRYIGLAVSLFAHLFGLWELWCDWREHRSKRHLKTPGKAPPVQRLPSI